MDYARHEEGLPQGLIPATLAHLVLGETLFLSDPRRTPITVIAHDPKTASFTVQVAAFEDAGAEWVLPLWDAAKFLAPPDGPTLTEAEQCALGHRIAQLDQRMEIPCDAAKQAETQARITATQSEVDTWLDRNMPDLPTNPARLLTGTQHCPAWSAALAQVLQDKELHVLDQQFVTQFASNPNAGETVKAHRIALAELGLCPYNGPIIRDPKTFGGEGTQEKRQAHIIARLAFMRVMVAKLGLSEPPLFRTICSETTLTAPRNTGFLSATFSQQVALSLFTAANATHQAGMYRQTLPPDRLFLSYFETPSLSAKFQEAEAVLLFDPANPVF